MSGSQWSYVCNSSFCVPPRPFVSLVAVVQQAIHFQMDGTTSIATGKSPIPVWLNVNSMLHAPVAAQHLWHAAACGSQQVKPRMTTYTSRHGGRRGHRAARTLPLPPTSGKGSGLTHTGAVSTRGAQGAKRGPRARFGTAIAVRRALGGASGWGCRARPRAGFSGARGRSPRRPPSRPPQSTRLSAKAPNTKPARGALPSGRARPTGGARRPGRERLPRQRGVRSACCIGCRGRGHNAACMRC